MAMRVYEARGYDVVGSIDDFKARRKGAIVGSRVDGAYGVILYQDSTVSDNVEALGRCVPGYDCPAREEGRSFAQ